MIRASAERDGELCMVLADLVMEGAGMRIVHLEMSLAFRNSKDSGLIGRLRGHAGFHMELAEMLDSRWLLRSVSARRSQHMGPSGPCGPSRRRDTEAVLGESRLQSLINFTSGGLHGAHHYQA